MENIQAHYRDISLARQWTEENSKHPDPELPKPYDILKETVRDAKEIPSLYSGVLMKSILSPFALSGHHRPGHYQTLPH